MANVTKELVLNETFMSTEQTPRNVADILADELENIANAIEGGGSGGHIIQNASGTDLAQEAKLQFGGMLKATDDSENGVTKVSDLAEEVEWSVWNAMTEAQRTAYSAGKKIDIINVPSVSGSIPVELIKTLWTNPNPTAEFAAQTITLDSDDYDFLIPVHQMVVNAPVYGEYSWIGRKGANIHCGISGSAGGNVNSVYRRLTYVDATHYTYGDSIYCINGSESVANVRSIPLAIYGIKSSVNVDMSALVANVSTSASKCMLSDGETSVEDAIDNRTSFIDASSSAIALITTIGDSWTATQNCWAVARARKENTSAPANPQVLLESIVMMNVTGVDYAFVVFPVMKGQTVSTRDVTNVVYNVVFYPMV